MDVWQITLVLLMGFSLAATCGLRAFLPLFIISLAAKAGMISLAPGFGWMESYPALICFGTATVLEIAGDKIPAVDHVLDAAGVFVRPIAGAIAASSLIQGMDPLLSLVIGIIVGSSVAGIVQALKGSLRIVSSVATGGTANPVISTVEDGTATVTGVASLFVPVLTGAVILVALFIVARVAVQRRRQRHRPAAGSARSVEVEE
jgi:large-conductance mechanosensitive channel